MGNVVDTAACRSFQTIRRVDNWMNGQRLVLLVHNLWSIVTRRVVLCSVSSVGCTVGRSLVLANGFDPQFIHKIKRCVSHLTFPSPSLPSHSTDQADTSQHALHDSSSSILSHSYLSHQDYNLDVSILTRLVPSNSSVSLKGPPYIT